MRGDIIYLFKNKKEIAIIFAVIITIVFFGTIMLPDASYANDTSLGRFGETVNPINDDDIVMQSENIIVHVTEEKSRVEAEFVFINDSQEEKKVLMGFPSGELEQKSGDAMESFFDYKLYDFKTLVEGTEVDVKLEKGIEPKEKLEHGFYDSDLSNFPLWYTWEVSFEPGEKKVVKNIYETKNTTNAMGMIQTGYVLTTGAPWKGKIENAKITFFIEDVKPYQFDRIEPVCTTFEEGKITWEFKDFEPDSNISVIYNIREKYMLEDRFLYDEKLKPIIDLKEEGKYKELVDFIDNIFEEKGYDTSDSFVETALKLSKAKALLEIDNEDSVKEAYEILNSIVDAGNTGTAESAYILLNYYKTKSPDEYANFYYNKIFLRTSGVLQRLAVDMFPDANISYGYAPEITNLKITPKRAVLDIEDKDDDIKKYSIEVWYIENGEKLHLLNYVNNNPMGFAIMHYRAGYDGFLPEVIGDAKLYYRVYVEDLTGNYVDTGEREISSYAMDAEQNKIDHWASDYVKDFLFIEEVSENIKDGDNYILNKDLFNILIKFTRASIAEKYKLKESFSDFLEDERFVTRAEAIDVIVRLLREEKAFKMDVLEPEVLAIDEAKYGKQFKDWDEIPYECKDNILIAARIGAIIGYPDAALRPNSFITTNEVLTMLERVKYGELSRIMGNIQDIRRDAYKNIILKDNEAFKWYVEHSGDNFVLYENGQWYLLEDGKSMGLENGEDKVYKQKCTEELAVGTKNSMPEIYFGEKDDKVEINIIQKLGAPPHRYVLTVDPSTLGIIERRIEDY